MDYSYLWSEEIEGLTEDQLRKIWPSYLRTYRYLHQMSSRVADSYLRWNRDNYFCTTVDPSQYLIHNGEEGSYWLIHRMIEFGDSWESSGNNMRLIREALAKNADPSILQMYQFIMQLHRNPKEMLNDHYLSQWDRYQQTQELYRDPSSRLSLLVRDIQLYVLNLYL